MNNHTTARKGKRVYVVLKDGTKFIDKFVERKSKFYYFETIGKVGVDSIKTFVIAR